MVGCPKMAGATVIDGDGTTGSMANELPSRAQVVAVAARGGGGAGLGGGARGERVRRGERGLWQWLSGVAGSGARGARGLRPRRSGVAGSGASAPGYSGSTAGWRRRRSRVGGE
jgi:hypothetical protein